MSPKWVWEAKAQSYVWVPKFRQFALLRLQGGILYKLDLIQLAGATAKLENDKLYYYIQSSTNETCV